MEWLGDAYTEVISSTLLYQTFPDLEAGRLSQLRELLIKNQTLGVFAKQYGLTSRVELTPDVRNSEVKMKKVPGDLLEAHVAAVILADPKHGLQRVGDWLRAIFSTIIKDQIRKSNKQSNGKNSLEMGNESKKKSDEPPKVRLPALIGAPGVYLRYEDDTSAPKKDKYNPKLTTYTVNLYMDGWGEKNMWLGRGTDLSKKQAGQKAAQMALNNASFMKKFSAKKAAFMAAQEANDAEDGQAN